MIVSLPVDVCVARMHVGDHAKITAQALSAWYYPGQSEVRTMNACESIATAIAKSVGQDQ
jgi:hypothetical protein